MSELESFRSEVRDWLEDNCPADMRRPMQANEDAFWGGRDATFQSDAQKLWFEAMAGRGWTVPEWPSEYGGGGLDKAQAGILRQELTSIGARVPLVGFGIWMLGPALLKFGNEEQKRTHLPRIAKGEIRWCQGYSEPNAGSDLASLQTKAEDKGDHYLVNGQKIWTSSANLADWIFCLVRTDPDAPKHVGISFLLFDMRTPGVSTKPIKLISGLSPFCETFFEDVVVPKENLVGTRNRGWDVAKFLLTHERAMIGGNMRENISLSQQARKQIGVSNGRLNDGILRTDIARFEIDELAFSQSLAKTRDQAKAGHNPGAASSYLKYYGTELNKRRNELLMDIGGADALEWESDASANGKLARTWLRSRANSIEGGTSEVQLNIISKRILKLPT